MPRKKTVTINDLAKKANVSMASVSRVINNDPSVRPEIRIAVEKAVEEMNYKHKTRSKNAHTNRIGLLIPDITNPYFPLLMKGITNIARVQGITTVLANSDLNEEIEAEHIKKLIDTGVDGLIYIPFSEHLSPSMQKLLDQNFPIVFLDREINLHHICSVTSDNKEGAYQATTYLLNLGHTDIACISGLPYLSTSVSRLEGFCKGMAEFNIRPKEELILHGDTSLGSGYTETIRLLDSNIPFTAIFATNDMMAFGAWKALEERGYSIPDDISIIGYDDIQFSSFISLTTIAQPAYEIGRNALLLLLDLISKRRWPPQKIVLRDSLIIRKSCKKI